MLSESPMSPTASARAGFKFYVGQSVEAQFTGTTRYYPGVVRKVLACLLACLRFFKGGRLAWLACHRQFDSGECNAAYIFDSVSQNL